MIDLVWFFQKRSFVLSREHENQNVATISTLLDQFMFEKGQDFKLSPILDHSKEKGPTLFWLLSL